MEQLVESVPNFSEATDDRLLAGIERAIAEASDAWLLDRTSDADHARSVFTLAGARDSVPAALEAAVSVAVDGIDMRHHRGQHPRLGAIDVVPFVPLGTTTMAECVGLARQFGRSISERHDLPVYLYGAAASRPERRVLADVRRPRFEGLSEAMARPEGEPDFGPTQPHPTAGATAVGARPFLIAFNIQLANTDVALARRIAATIRERDGGLAAVQALGLDLPSLGCTQVSMNLLDHDRTPMWQVWEAVEGLAAEAGTAVLDSELIGLAPAAALTAVADHLGLAPADPIEQRLVAVGAALRIRDFDPDMALEIRLARARALNA